MQRIRTTVRRQLSDQRHKIGARAEALAEQHLIANGYRVVKRNYLCRLGEIDLIVFDERFLAFVEVRYRGRSAIGSASESVTTHKQRRIINAARHFLQHHPDWRNTRMRFDVVAVDECAPSKHTLVWHTGAFDAGALG